MWGSILLVALLAAPALSAAVNEGGKEVPIEDSNTVGGFVKSETIVEDPCTHHPCGLGRECDLDEDRRPICVCIRECLDVNDPSNKICSSHNVTFDSECELNKIKCQCHNKSPECPDARYQDAQLDYFGECRAFKECTDYEMEGYPERMRNWLYLIMEELARREDLPKQAMELVEQAKSVSSRRWVLPVIWKFCELDQSNDRHVSVEELTALSAPIKAQEHCTGPFLQLCDRDRDGLITLGEWGVCLGLEKDEIQDRCQILRD